MLSTAVQRLIHLHGIKPGNRAVIVASGAQGDEVAADLRDAGVEVVATVRSGSGDFGASAPRTSRRFARQDGEFACDLLVVCGQRVPDAGLLASGRRQARVERRARSVLAGRSAGECERGGRSDGRMDWRAPRLSRRSMFRTTSARSSVSAPMSSTADLRDGIAKASITSKR